jgi:cytochrome c biogenesis protein CcmG, thiol:disulfide interchange protein DsbE
MKLKHLLPLGLFFVLVGFLFKGLFLDPREVPSPLIDKPAPAFRLAQLHSPDKTLGLEDMRGKVWLFNVWASWCVACRDEHPVLVEFARQKRVPLIGLNYKDKREDGLAWLLSGGDPYDLSVADTDGRVGIDYGVYGVPETFLIDKEGRIRYKQIGPITPDALEKEILPRIQALQRG